ncbi:hypothetical protein HY933_02600 [Candidatus Falkowbacteria bacterium]|nr:hypothetical protein [Candidatus Falkowbacteria bacterium]
MASNKYGEELASWEFPEFVAHERSRAWYVIAIIIGGLLLLYAVLAANFLFAVIILVAAVVIFLRSSQPPQSVPFALYEDGIRIGQKFYDFSEVKSFCIIYNPPEVKSLYFNFNSLWQPRMRIPLDDVDPLSLRDLLLEYLAEDLDQEDEPFSDGISRLFKL